MFNKILKIMNNYIRILLSDKIITNISRRAEKNKDDNLFDLIESMYDKEE